MSIQVQLFQLVVTDGAGLKQVDIDSARQNLQSQVNSFLASVTPSFNVLDVQFNETIIASGNLLLTAEVTYKG